MGWIWLRQILRANPSGVWLEVSKNGHFWPFLDPKWTHLGPFWRPRPPHGGPGATTTRCSGCFGRDPARPCRVSQNWPLLGVNFGQNSSFFDEFWPKSHQRWDLGRPSVTVVTDGLAKPRFIEVLTNITSNFRLMLVWKIKLRLIFGVDVVKIHHCFDVVNLTPSNLSSHSESGLNLINLSEIYQGKFSFENFPIRDPAKQGPLEIKSQPSRGVET